MNELINADFSRRVVIDTNHLPWVPSPQAGVERRMLDRIGGETARATSLVRYAPDCVFPAHGHQLGEEFLVLKGVFSDEHGDYPAGTYVRNPPGSRHSPRTRQGCTILVKLRQMLPGEHARVVIDTTQTEWRQGECPGHSRQLLYSAGSQGEQVTMERLTAETRCTEVSWLGGEEIFVLTGELEDEHGTYRAGTWARSPPGYRRSFASRGGVAYWAKRGHLSVVP